MSSSSAISLPLIGSEWVVLFFPLPVGEMGETAVIRVVTDWVINSIIKYW